MAWVRSVGGELVHKCILNVLTGNFQTTEVRESIRAGKFRLNHKNAIAIKVITYSAESTIKNQKEMQISSELNMTKHNRFNYLRIKQYGAWKIFTPHKLPIHIYIYMFIGWSFLCPQYGYIYIYICWAGQFDYKQFITSQGDIVDIMILWRASGRHRLPKWITKSFSRC